MGADERETKDTAREFEEDGERRRNTGNLSDKKLPVPLFLKGRNDSRHDNDQDEKDGTAE